MLAVNVLDVIKWFIENLVEIALFVSIVIGLVQTWRSNRKGFWTKLKTVAEQLVIDAEAMPEFKKGEGTKKSAWVIEQLLEEFGNKFAFITEKKLQKIINQTLKVLNTFSKLN